MTNQDLFDSDLDDLLRQAFQSAAPSADPSGVADAIRARVEAGEAGIAAGGTAPGWGGGPLNWLPWIGLIVAAGLVGGSLGPLGVFGAAVDEIAVVGYSSMLDGTADALQCPGGPAVRELGAGTRVLAVERDEDGDFLGIRDPNNSSRVIWLATADIVVDDGEPATSTLPIGDACPQVIVTLPTEPVETSEPVEPVEPGTPGGTPPGGPAQPPPPPADTTAPVVAKIEIVELSPGDGCNYQIRVESTDNVAVTGVALTWSGKATGSGQMSFSGGVWRYPYTVPGGSGSMTFKAVARDAAGNTSTQVQVTEPMMWECLI